LTTEEISKLLDSIRPQIFNVNDPSLQVAVTTLFNLVEFMFAENNVTNVLMGLYYMYKFIV